MDSVNLIYIDDAIDPGISKCLSQYEYDGITIKYDEIKFKTSNGYEGLLRDNRIKEANVIIIDSRLFQNQSASNGKYTGEQFKLILKKLFPYIEVIVITQNDIPTEYPFTISKYSSKQNESEENYYKRLFESKIGEAIKVVCEYRIIASEMKPDYEISYLVERIKNSLDGLDIYDGLKKSDIDELVVVFKNIQESLDG